MTVFTFDRYVITRFKQIQHHFQIFLAWMHREAVSYTHLIGVCGCMAQEESIVNTLLETYRHVNLIFGTHNLHRLPELLYQVMIGHEKSVEVFSKEGDVIENLPVRRFGKYKAWVNIMYGCDKFCTYCIDVYKRQ